MVMGKMQMRWSPERILQQSQLEAHRIRYIHNPEPLLEVPKGLGVASSTRVWKPLIAGGTPVKDMNVYLDLEDDPVCKHDSFRG